jgi:hypothetical protein
VAQQPAARGREWIITHSNRHDTGSTTSRSVDEIALIWDTIGHYAPVLIGPFRSTKPAIFFASTPASSQQQVILTQIGRNRLRDLHDLIQLALRQRQRHHDDDGLPLAVASDAVSASITSSAGLFIPLARRTRRIASS